MNDPLIIGGKEFNSRLMVGTGRHRSMEEMVASVQSSGAEIITVAIRRLDLDNPAEKNILDYFDWDEYTILPNTAGCKTADEAVFTAQLAREVTGSDWIKLEVIPGTKAPSARSCWHLRGGVQAGGRRVHRIAVHPCRPGPRDATGRYRLRHRDAARLAHRLRARAFSRSMRSALSSPMLAFLSWLTRASPFHPKHRRLWKPARTASSLTPQSRRQPTPS